MNVRQAERLKNVPPSGTRSVHARAGILADQGRSIIDLSVGQPDFPTPEYIKNAAKQALDSNMTGYPPAAGIEQLREEIASDIFKTIGVSYASDEIIVTTGVAQGIFASMMSFLESGDEILLPDPGYNAYISTARLTGAVIRTYDLFEDNNFSINIEQLRGLINSRTKMLVLISPNNPVGSIIREDILEKISDLLKGTDVLVLSDEIYSRIMYEDFRYKSVSAFPGMRERCIILNGFSKYYSMTGWRIGYIASPKELTVPMLSMCSMTTACTNSISQYAAVAALRNPSNDICEGMRAELNRRCEYLYTELNKIKNISCLKPEGSFYIFLNIKKTGMTSEEFSFKLLEECGVAVVPGTVFGENGKGYVRLSFASSFEDIVETASRINQWMQ